MLYLRHILICCLAVLFSIPVGSSTSWSVIEGIVSDESGAILIGAQVIVVSIERNSKRTALTNSSGYYRVPMVEPGNYTVSATFSGLEKQSVSNVSVKISQSARVDIRLRVETPSQELEVLDTRETVDSSTSGISALLGQESIEELPLNGRDYIQLSTLEPGVHLARAQSRNFNNGYGIPLSISGSRPAQNTFLVDGTQVSDYTGATPGSINGVSLGTDAIQEFSILTSSYSAQQGTAAGGVIQAVTRSGSNKFHGSAFFFHRNDNLDARNFFDRERKPEFRRHQFGFSVGGPITTDRLFFFSNLEWFREVRGSTQIDTTLSQDARDGFLQDSTVEVDPSIARVLEFYPLPNDAVLGDTGLFVFSNDLNADEFFATTKFDFIVSESDQILFRYTIDDAGLIDETAFALSKRTNSTRQQSFTLGETHFFSSSLLTSNRLGFSRTRASNNLTEAQVEGIDDPELGFLPDSSTVGIISIPGVSQFPGGTGALDADLAAFNSFQFYDDWTWLKGSHSINVGVTLQRKHLNIDSQSRQSGEYRFLSIGDFLTDQPDRFRAQLPGSDTVRGFRQWLFAWYFQNSWRVSRQFNIDLGIRHEWTTVPTEVNGKLANLDQLTDSETRVGSPLYENPSLTNFAPRIGVAFDLDGTGKTLIRGGFGIFHDQLGLHYLLLTGVRNPPFFLRGSIRQLQQGAFPKGGYLDLIQSPTLDLRVERIPQNLSQPYVSQWNLTFERALAKATTLRLAYVGSRGVNLSTIIEDANLAIPVRLPDGRLFFSEEADRLNPVFSQIRDREFLGGSFYHSLQANLRWDTRKDIYLNTSYTLSKSIDDSSTTFAQTESANAIGIPVNDWVRFNRGLSNHHQKHRFSGSLIWQIPGPEQEATRLILGGWRVSLIGAYASGVPFTSTLSYDAARTQTNRPDRRGGQRPDLAAPFNNNPVTGDPNQWFDPSAFSRPDPGFLGNLGRNTLFGHDYRNVDLALVKRFLIAAPLETVSLDFRVEFFNLFNHTNFDLPEPERMEVFTETGIPEDVGRITSAAPSREIQFGLKLIF